MKNLLFFVLVISLFSCKSNVEQADDLRLENKFEEAVALYKEAADEGNAYAKWRLYKAYSHGDGVDFDLDIAKKYLEAADKEGCDEASCDLACSYMYGWQGYDKDENKGKEKLKKLASTSTSAYVLARYSRALFYGWTFEEDKEKAETLLEKVTDKNNDLYLRTLADVYHEGGDKIERNIDKAIELYSKAYENGSSYAAYDLADIYYNGFDKIKKDTTETLKWLNKGIERNSDACMLFMSRLCLSEDSLLQDIHNEQKGVDLVKKAAKHGNGDAYNRLGTWFQFGEHVAKDDNKAMENYQKAYSLKSAGGAFSLGLAYIEGIGCTKDFAKAIEIWKRGVEYGSGGAANNLYCIYNNDVYGMGHGVINKELAKKYLMKAAELDDIMGCLNIGRQYYSGKGLLEKNDTQAFIYIKKAADMGQVDACRVLAYFYENGIGCSKNPNEAKKYEDMTKAKEK